MKKTGRLSFGLALLLMLFVSGLSACSHDKDDDKFIDPDRFTQNDPSLVGTWTHVEGNSQWSEVTSYIINPNGTYVKTEVETDSRGQKSSWENGTWNTNAQRDMVLFTVSDSSDPSDIGEQEVEYYSVRGNILTLDRKEYTTIPGI